VGCAISSLHFEILPAGFDVRLVRKLERRSRLDKPGHSCKELRASENPGGDNVRNAKRKVKARATANARELGAGKAIPKAQEKGADHTSVRGQKGGDRAY